MNSSTDWAEPIGSYNPDRRVSKVKSRLSRVGKLRAVLVVNTDEIEHLTVPAKLRRRLTKKFHAVQAEERFRHVFSACIDFVVPIAAPYAERGFQAAEFCDAFG
jgi:hypothetical protein